MSDQPSKGPSPDWARAGATFAPIGVLTVIVGIAPLPTWASVVALCWLLLCLIAWLGTLDAASCAHIKNSLEKDRFTQIYEKAVGRQLKLLWRRYCDDAPEDAGLLPTFRAALTWRLYDAALLLAVAYPIFLLVGWWLLGFDGRVGSAVLLPAAPFWPDRAAAVGAFTVIALSFAVAHWGAARTQGALRAAVGFLPLLTMMTVAMWGLGTNILPGLVQLAFAFAFPAIVVAAVTFTAARGSFGGAAACVFAFAAAAAAAFATAFALAFAVAVVIGATSALLALDRKGRQRLVRGIVTAALPALWIVGALSLPWDQVSDAVRGAFVFFAVFPLLNALFDVVSYAATLTLMRRGLRAKLPVLYGLVDFAVALVLFLALGAALTAVVAGLNRLAGVPILDLGVLFAGLHAEPHQYWWLYAMVFSTILPTALHGALSLLGAQAFAPLAMRRPVADLLAGGAAWKAVAAPLAIGAVWAVPFLAAAVILWGLWWLGADALAALGGFYLQTLTDLAVWIGAF